MGTPNPIRLDLDDLGLAPGRCSAAFGRRALRWSERLLLVFGIVCIAYLLYVYVEARLYQTFEDRELDEILNSRTAKGASGTERENALTRSMLLRTVPASGSMVGRIEIPRLGVSSVIRAGSDARTLRLAVGYIPGTALPGDPGNFGLAGHRDTFFRKLRDINPDDEIRIVTKDGTFHYYVERTTIVMPQDVSVLDPTNHPTLTLVTCYPFNYIGSAPKRFIVRAALSPIQPAARSTVTTPAETVAARAATAVRAKVAPKKSNVRPRVGRTQRGLANSPPKRSTVPIGSGRAKASLPRGAKAIPARAKTTVSASAKRTRATTTNRTASTN
jgi:sortase A